MKKILREVFSYAIALFLTSLFFSGLNVRGGIVSYFIGAFFITIGEYILKPVFALIALPLQLLTLGLFSFVLNAIILLIVAKVYPSIAITSFHFNGTTILGVRIPAFDANIILSYLVISATIYIIAKLFNWIYKD